MSGVVIDSHMHLFTEMSGEFPRGTHELHPPERRAEVADYLLAAQETGIDHSILVSLDENDEYMRHVLTLHPKRFSAVSVMDATSTDPVSDFHRHLDGIPIVGYRVWTLGADNSLQIPDTHLDLLAALEAKGVAAWFYSDEVQLRALAEVVNRFPNLPIILNHLGFCQTGFNCDRWGRPRVPTVLPPATQGIVDKLASHENVAVLFSGHYAFSEQDYPYADLFDTSDRLLQVFGADRLLWASDWPWIEVNPGYPALRNLVQLQLPGLSASEMDQIMGGNSSRLLGIEVDLRDERS